MEHRKLRSVIFLTCNPTHFYLRERIFPLLEFSGISIYHFLTRLLYIAPRQTERVIKIDSNRGSRGSRLRKQCWCRRRGRRWEMSSHSRSEYRRKERAMTTAMASDLMWPFNRSFFMLFFCKKLELCGCNFIAWNCNTVLAAFFCGSTFARKMGNSLRIVSSSF